KLTAREDAKELNELLEHETEELGEDKAKKRLEIRQKLNARFRTVEDKEKEITTKSQEVEATAEKLSNIQREQLATKEALTLVFPQDKTLASKVNGYVKRLTAAETPKEFELILEGIKKEVKGKPFRPANTRGSGGGGDNLSNLSPREKIEYGLAHPKKT
ncbi:MAG: hypothetical protein WC822_05280, partial [Candidatus Paceibacterota bacterium]